MNPIVILFLAWLSIVLVLVLFFIGANRNNDLWDRAWEDYMEEKKKNEKEKENGNKKLNNGSS